MRSLESLDFDNDRALIRVDFNVPMSEGKVADDFRIQAALPSIKHCIDHGASVVLMSHLGRPGGVPSEDLSLMPVGETLCDHLEMSIKFSHDCVSDDAIDVSHELQAGEVHLLENLRFHTGETKNDHDFASRLAQHGTCFINDAFGTAHRAHASNVGVTDFLQNCTPGFLMAEEFKFLHSAVIRPKRPFTIVLGGAKIGTKLPLVTRFIREADNVIIGGGMAFTFLKMAGYKIGKSIYDDSLLQTAKQIVEMSKSLNCEFHLPSDIVVTEDISSGQDSAVRKVSEIDNNEIGVDIGPETIDQFCETINGSSTVIWNGPMGIIETEAYSGGTKAVAEAFAQMTGRGGLSIIGGGDSASVVRDLNLWNEMTHISTGGGASLELLAGRDLPAMKALEMV